MRARQRDTVVGCSRPTHELQAGREHSRTRSYTGRPPRLLRADSSTESAVWTACRPCRKVTMSALFPRRASRNASCSLRSGSFQLIALCDHCVPSLRQDDRRRSAASEAHGRGRDADRAD